MPKGPAEEGTLEYARERLANYQSPAAIAKMDPTKRQRKVDKWTKEIKRLRQLQLPPMIPISQPPVWPQPPKRPPKKRPPKKRKPPPKKRKPPQTQGIDIENADENARLRRGKRRRGAKPIYDVTQTRVFRSPTGSKDARKLDMMTGEVVDLDKQELSPAPPPPKKKGKRGPAPKGGKPSNFGNKHISYNEVPPGSGQYRTIIKGTKPGGWYISNKEGTEQKKDMEHAYNFGTVTRANRDRRYVDAAAAAKANYKKNHSHAAKLATRTSGLGITTKTNKDGQQIYIIKSTGQNFGTDLEAAQKAAYEKRYGKASSAKVVLKKALRNHTVKELQEICRKHGIKFARKKKQYIENIQAHIDKQVKIKKEPGVEQGQVEQGEVKIKREIKQEPKEPTPDVQILGGDLPEPKLESSPDVAVVNPPPTAHELRQGQSDFIVYLGGRPNRRVTDQVNYTGVQVIGGEKGARISSEVASSLGRDTYDRAQLPGLDTGEDDVSVHGFDDALPAEPQQIPQFVDVGVEGEAESVATDQLESVADAIPPKPPKPPKPQPKPPTIPEATEDELDEKRSQISTQPSPPPKPPKPPPPPPLQPKSSPPPESEPQLPEALLDDPDSDEFVPGEEEEEEEEEEEPEQIPLAAVEALQEGVVGRSKVPGSTNMGKTLPTRYTDDPNVVSGQLELVMHKDKPKPKPKPKPNPMFDMVSVFDDGVTVATEVTDNEAETGNEDPFYDEANDALYAEMLQLVDIDNNKTREQFVANGRKLMDPKFDPIREEVEEQMEALAEDLPQEWMELEKTPSPKPIEPKKTPSSKPIEPTPTPEPEEKEDETEQVVPAQPEQVVPAQPLNQQQLARRRNFPAYTAARAQGLRVGYRMVRRRPIPFAQIQQAEAPPRPPGRTINPAVVNWYAQQSFEPKYEEDDMSKLYPWLFGSEGLYSGIVCPYPCRVVNGACDCD